MGFACPKGETQIPSGNVFDYCVNQICGPLPTLTPTKDCIAPPAIDYVKRLACYEASHYSLGTIINIIMSYVYPFAGIAIFFVLVAAGYDYILSWGDSEKLTSAWSKITYAVIGFVILISIYAITRIVGAIFGLSQIF